MSFSICLALMLVECVFGHEEFLFQDGVFGFLISHFCREGFSFSGEDIHVSLDGCALACLLSSSFLRCQ